MYRPSAAERTTLLLAVGQVPIGITQGFLPALLRPRRSRVLPQDGARSLSVADELPREVRSLVCTVVVLLCVLVPALVSARVGVKDVPVVLHRMKKMAQQAVDFGSS
ncbi:hypothetical protein I4F81_007687 [Pyropia yezoensis]|uniref:Uncharacterized protein n=2 Tax=Pyropia yezoensis TaxID=2788 RepID=A0ACC3C5R6_PYRYE|nr:hypothetical protein I4F81_007684 [Neopyropia yezoensis]KAK1865152.1 hypothetical protein I4F81_007687 [Neopyropia yezoensis]